MGALTQVHSLQVLNVFRFVTRKVDSSAYTMIGKEYQCSIHKLIVCLIQIYEIGN